MEERSKCGGLDVNTERSCVWHHTKSQLVESPLGRWSLLSIWEAWWPTGRQRTRCHSQNWLDKSSFHHAQKHLGIWRSQHENQTLHFQHQCEVSPALRMWDMANNTMQQKIQTFFNTCLRRIYKIQWQEIWNEDRSVGVNRTGTSGQADTAEEVGLDRTHPQEASIQHHTPSPGLEPAGEESQQLEARHWSRAKTARDQLVWNDQSSPERSAMARGRWWPMLHWEQWAFISKRVQNVLNNSKPKI